MKESAVCVVCGMPLVDDYGRKISHAICSRHRREASVRFCQFANRSVRDGEVSMVGVRARCLLSDIEWLLTRPYKDCEEFFGDSTEQVMDSVLWIDILLNHADVKPLINGRGVKKEGTNDIGC